MTDPAFCANKEDAKNSEKRNAVLKTCDRMSVPTARYPASFSTFRT
jgi:hypothetical protein